MKKKYINKFRLKSFMSELGVKVESYGNMMKVG